MRFRDYLSDRLGWLAVYFAGGGIAVLVMELDGVQPRTSASAGTIAYTFMLLTVLLAAFLWWDFARQARFYRSLSRLTSEYSRFEDAASPAAAATREQALFVRAISTGFRHYQEQLERYRHREEQHQRFSDRWVHLMKTPVSVINLLVRQGVEAKTPAEAREVFESIGEEDDRLLHGLEMFLSSARLDRFEMDLRVERVDILSVARDVLNAHKKELIRSSVFPRVDPADGQVLVATDPKWIRFVLEQLVANAIKYTGAARPEESKTLAVVASQIPSGWVVSVKDQGIGIPPEDLPRIFDPFFTGKNGRLVHESTGMGLYLAREVVKRLGHEITAESEPGRGTSVSLVFSSGSIADGVLTDLRGM